MDECWCPCETQETEETTLTRVLGLAPGQVITPEGLLDRPPGWRGASGLDTPLTGGALLGGSSGPRKHGARRSGGRAPAPVILAAAPPLPGLFPRVIPGIGFYRPTGSGRTRIGTLRLETGVMLAMCELDGARVLVVTATPAELVAQLVDTRTLTLLQTTRVALDLPIDDGEAWVFSVVGNALSAGVELHLAGWWMVDSDRARGVERTLSVDAACTATLGTWTALNDHTSGGVSGEATILTAARTAWENARRMPFNAFGTGRLVDEALVGTWSSPGDGLWRLELPVAVAPDLNMGAPALGDVPQVLNVPVVGAEERALWIRDGRWTVGGPPPPGTWRRRVFDRLRGTLFLAATPTGQRASPLTAFGLALAGVYTADVTLSLSPDRPLNISAAPLLAAVLNGVATGFPATPWWQARAGRGVNIPAAGTLTLTFALPPGTQFARAQVRLAQNSARLTVSAPVDVGQGSPDAAWRVVGGTQLTLTLSASQATRVLAVTLETAN